VLIAIHIAASLKNWLVDGHSVFQRVLLEERARFKHWISPCAFQVERAPPSQSISGEKRHARSKASSAGHKRKSVASSLR